MSEARTSRSEVLSAVERPRQIIRLSRSLKEFYPRPQRRGKLSISWLSSRKCFTIFLRSLTHVRILGEAAKYFLITIAILYALDFAVFQIRHFRGSGLSTIAVDQFLSTPLKGNKAEYDYLGTANQTCARTLFPQYASSTWNPPCWWLQHHNATWQ